ncbi:disease resistance protein L6-like [Rhodamnia argentea]|uniref:Disease resistance protein L6-like n=1 Tax=Rhodamnia argentea TaxID=178133 RepID=A0ABM3GY21_9MYRT|nr:disease resistance protein L6-like [Rhodamnia argentea]
MPNRREGEFARKLTQKVFNKLKKAFLVVSDCLVNVDNHVDAIMEMIGARTSETRIIGIHGMGGIGKTTIAKIIYNKLSHDFENCCFLCDIRERSETNGIRCLQNQLISDILERECIDIKDIDGGIQTIKDRLSNKRVLLLLDDVDKGNHIDALVGKCDWLGRGSKIIITTRNKDILGFPEVDLRYELSGMDHDQSLQLFSRHAFRTDYPSYVYIDQSKRAIEIARGLPLALEVIGSLLCRTKKEKWDLTLKKLENVPHAVIQSELKISYDALDVQQQHIFLDIACLFIGYDKDILAHFWDESNFFMEDAMEVLQNMSLIKITEDNKVWMHDQVRDFGREMVREESNMKIKKQSRVWDHKEGLDLLRKYKGNKEVEALRLKFDHERHYFFTCEGFMGLSNLRFLEVDGSLENFHAEKRLLWDELPSNVLPINENSDLLPRLRWLSWHKIPPTFNITNFSMEDVVILDLSESEITHDWEGWSHMKVIKNLKVLNLSRCENLQSLPDELGRGLASLEYLCLNYCKSLMRLPDSIGNLESLIELHMSHTSFKELPHSIGNLKNLKVVNMWGCRISETPKALWTIGKLEEVEGLFFPESHVKIGNCIYKNQCLRILRLNVAHVYALPRLPESLVTLDLEWLDMDRLPDLSNLANLKELHLSFDPPPGYDWKSDGLVEYPIPPWIENLTKLESLHLKCHFMTTSPTDLSLPPQLKSLYLRCSNLRRLPRLPSRLTSLNLDECYSLCSIEDLSNLKNLSYLSIWSTAIMEIQGLGCLENLQDLRLCSLGHVKILPVLSNLNKLRRLQVAYCGNLVEIRGKLPESLEILEIDTCESLRKLPDLSRLMELREVCIGECGSLIEIQCELPKSLEKLEIYFCKSLQKLPDLSSLMGLREVCIGECGNLVEIQGELPESLEELKISFCESLQKLPNMSSLMGLREFCVGECGSLVEIQGELPQSLENLEIRSCKSLQKLPDLSGLLGLREVCIEKCGNLVEIQGELPQSLEELKISFCKSLQKLPNLSSLKELRRVEIDRCRKLNMEAISSLCLEKSVEFVGEDAKSESEQEGEDEESESEGEDAKPETEYEGEDDKCDREDSNLKLREDT